MKKRSTADIRQTFLDFFQQKQHGEKRREAFNIVLSMPPGTDRQSVKEAARQFAVDQFKKHQYVFVAHDDEKHPHVQMKNFRPDADRLFKAGGPYRLE